MTVSELDKILGGHGSLITDGARAVLSFYAGDFLSNVIGKAAESAAWFTVMNNVNVAGVAVIAESAAVVLCEGVKPDTELEKRARQQGINLILTELPVYEACIAAASITKQVRFSFDGHS